MGKVCVYVVNENPYYLRMLSVSLTMLRRHNPHVTVRVYGVSGQGRFRGQKLFRGLNPDEIETLCERLGVEFVKSGEESTYLGESRQVLAAVTEDSVLHLDADTFVLGDVAPLFDRYADYDFVACDSVAIMKKAGFDSQKYLSINPIPFYNSGVMILNNGWCRRWAGELVGICERLRRKELPAGEYMHEQRARGNEVTQTSWEEMATNVFVSENRLHHASFERNDCLLPAYLRDLKDIDKTIVLHAYSHEWRQFYQRLAQKGMIKRDSKPAKLFRRLQRQENNPSGSPPPGKILRFMSTKTGSSLKIDRN